MEPRMTGLRLATAAHAPDLSVVVPVYNEAENLADLSAEIVSALRGRASFEIVFVDDGSTDATAAELVRLTALYPEVRPVSHDGKSGQSVAVSSGAWAARGKIIVTIDGDGQNDPAFILPLAKALAAGQPGTGLAAGRRIGRKATRFKKLQSRIANAVRGAILRDGTTDTGCGLKAIPRELFLRLPVFDGLHRFLPALVRREGYAIVQVDVVDRDRRHGISKYGLWDRLWVGLMDLMGVWWLIRRRKCVPNVRELKPDADRSVADGRELFAGRVRQ
jgi:glycosyltransferase involved in cell wall biosynthesis